MVAAWFPADHALLGVGAVSASALRDQCGVVVVHRCNSSGDVRSPDGNRQMALSGCGVCFVDAGRISAIPTRSGRDITRRNPLFPYVYRLGMPIFGKLFYDRYRREAMRNATGRLLMIGIGPGTDVLFLPPAVTSVAAVEPEAVFRRMASNLAGRRGIAIDVVDGIAESIPFPDNSFESVHVGLVLCSVDDVDAGLREIRRVLVPGGRLVV